MNCKNLTTFILLFCLTCVLGTNVWAQRLDTASQEIEMPYFKPVKLTHFIVPAVFIGYGFAALHNKALNRLDFSTNAELREDHPSFSSSADDYLRWAPAVAVYGLDLAGIKSKHNFVDRTALLLLSGTISAGATGYLKADVHRLRPNAENYHSFPSGHTTIAFTTAEFLNQEYGERSIWYSIGGYAAATLTGTLRMYNGAHWFSDVVAGAGIGIASTKITYLIYPYLKKAILGKKSEHTVIIPSWQAGSAGMVLVHAF